MKSVVRRIDHLIIRIADPQYDDLMRVFTEDLGLVSPWPPTEHPTFKSGGVFAGNVDFEIARFHTGELRRARLFGMVFELCDWDVSELKRRSIPYIATPYSQFVAGQGRIPKWLNVFLKDLVGSNVWMTIYFGLSRLIPASFWEKAGSGDNANNAAAVDFVFNKVYCHGTVFAVKYNDAWRAVDSQRQANLAAHDARGGGLLDLMGVEAIVVGVRDLNKAHRHWDALLQPVEPTGHRWELGDGPAIQLVPHSEDRLLRMIWKVRSLAAARQALAAHGTLGAMTPEGQQILPEALYGLDVRLVEA